MSRTLEQGRPALRRGEREEAVYDFLDRLQIEYTRADHPPAATMADCIAVDEALGCRMCKNLFLCNRQATDFYLLMIRGDKQFKTKDVSAQIGSSRLSFGSAEHMEALLDLTPGSVSVMGLMNDREGRVRLLIDEDVLKGEYVGCHPCINTSSLRLRTEDLTKKILPAMGHVPTMVKL